MKILAIDTTSHACSIAVDDGRQVYNRHDIAPMRHTQLVLESIQQVLQLANLSMSQIDLIAYGCGPGSFTGIRIANSVVQGLGYAHRKPIIPISSLACLAQTLYMHHGHTDILVAVDARMQQIYYGYYKVINHLTVESQRQDKLIYPKDLDYRTDQMAAAVGDGWRVYEAELSAVLTKMPSPVFTDESIMATAILPLAKQYYDEGRWVAPGQAVPIYLR